MRKLFSIAGAAMLATVALVTPAGAQAMGAFGSCGYASGDYGTNSLFADPSKGLLNTVPNLFYQVNYYGLPAPTALGVIIRYGGDARNDELNEQRGVAATVVEGAFGSFGGVLRSSINPDDSGGGTNFARQSNRGYGSGMNANHFHSEKTQGARAGASTSTSDKSGQYLGSAGGLGPGLYTFTIYTGEFRDLPEMIKDGPAGRRFFADEKAFLGWFSCAVEDNR